MSNEHHEQDRTPWTKQRLIDIRDQCTDHEMKKALRKAIEMINEREGKLNEVRIMLRAVQKMMID